MGINTKNRKGATIVDLEFSINNNIYKLLRILKHKQNEI